CVQSAQEWYVVANAALLCSIPPLLAIAEGDLRIERIGPGDARHDKNIMRGGRSQSELMQIFSDAAKRRLRILRQDYDSAPAPGRHALDGRMILRQGRGHRADPVSGYHTASDRSCAANGGRVSVGTSVRSTAVGASTGTTHRFGANASRNAHRSS